MQYHVAMASLQEVYVNEGRQAFPKHFLLVNQELLVQIMRHGCETYSEIRKDWYRPDRDILSLTLILKHDWFNSFLERNKELSILKPEIMSVCRGKRMMTEEVN
jgi:hypothetical protein